MKNLKIFSVSLLVLFATTAFSQIKLLGEGKFGNEWTNNDYNNEVSHEFFGLSNDSYRPGAKISLGDYGSSANGGANVYIGEAFGWDSDQLDVHGKYGIFFTVNGTAGSIIGASINGTGDLDVTRNVSAVAYTTRSDVRLKTNIKNLNSALASVIKLQGISYDFKSTIEDANLTVLNKVDAKEDKDKKDLAKAKKGYEDRKAENLNHMGFSAQDVQKIFPSIVKTDTDGFLSVNYTALIPVAVEAIKEQQKIIEDQAKIIDAQQKDIIAIKRKLGMQ
jgi:Chaperone of endosialidase